MSHILCMYFVCIYCICCEEPQNDLAIELWTIHYQEINLKLNWSASLLNCLHWVKLTCILCISCICLNSTALNALLALAYWCTEQSTPQISMHPLHHIHSHSIGGASACVTFTWSAFLLHCLHWVEFTCILSLWGQMGRPPTWPRVMGNPR